MCAIAFSCCQSYLHRITSTVTSIRLQRTIAAILIHEDAGSAVRHDVVFSIFGVRRDEFRRTANAEWMSSIAAVLLVASAGGIPCRFT